MQRKVHLGKWTRLCARHCNQRCHRNRYSTIQFEKFWKIIKKTRMFLKICRILL